MVEVKPRRSRKAPPVPDWERLNELLQLGAERIDAIHVSGESAGEPNAREIGRRLMARVGRFATTPYNIVNKTHAPSAPQLTALAALFGHPESWWLEAGRVIKTRSTDPLSPAVHDIINDVQALPPDGQRGIARIVRDAVALYRPDADVDLKPPYNGDGPPP